MGDMPYSQAQANLPRAVNDYGLTTIQTAGIPLLLFTINSPNKTWEGFLLGAATTVAVALLLAPFLTPFADRPFHVGQMEFDIPYVSALAAGLLIVVGGFFGDITMSAVKRDAGAKDSGTLFMAKSGWYHGASQASVPGHRDGGFCVCADC